MSGHQRLDARSLAMHRAIAVKLRQDPTLLAIAHDNLDRWSVSSGGSQPYFDAWRELLELPLVDLLERILEESERMTAMRQTNPFAGILTPTERWAIYDQFPPEAPTV